METIESAPDINQEIPVTKPAPKKKPFVLLAIALLAVVIAIVLFLLLNQVVKSGRQPLPSPTPTAEATPSAKRVPSSLATESGFLKLEDDLLNLQKETSQVDLSEPKLSLPILEMNISF